MILYIEVALSLAAFATLWFVNGVFRLRKLSASRVEYLEKFAEICDDDNIPMYFLEASQSVFKLGNQYFSDMLIFASFSKAQECRE